MSDTPRKLGRYELIRRIAAGGMGEIYLARARGTAGFEKTVIIKTILPHLAKEDEFVDKFLDEGRIVVNLTHGNIVPVFDMDEEDGEYFIAMDYVPGRDLRDILKRLDEREESMPVDLASYVVSEVCEGLGYAHRKTDEEGNPLDIVHRDVSPSNVLISTDGEVKIIDFGIARAADKRAQTLSGRIQGKCCYMSPEQASGESLDHRSDIFSAGVVFYEMLTGVRPFEGDSDLKSLELVRTCEFDPPSEFEDRIPEEIDEIVDRALAEDPEDRYQRIDDMKVDLMEFLVSRGRAVTSEEVAEFLGDMFPEGLEREAFREVREEAAEPSGPMGLDDALEYQLDQMGGPAAEVDPLEETLPEEREEAERVDGKERTATLARKGDDSEGAEGEAESDGPTAPTALERPGESQRTAPGSEEAPETAESDSESDDWRLWGGVAAAVALVLGGGAIYQMLQPDRGVVELRTTPSGASIEVDGSIERGVETPAELKLSGGEHTLVLSKEGFKDQTMKVDVLAGEREMVSTELSEKNDEKSTEPEVRRFVVRSQPTNAKLWADEQKLGRAPQPVEVERGEMTFVEAKKEGCRTGRKPIYYEHRGKVATVRLDCTDVETDSEKDAGSKQAASETEKTRAQQPAAPTPRPDPRVEVEFRSIPSSAEVFVDGESLGHTPVRQTFLRSETLKVRVEKSGYETATRSVRVDTVEDGVWQIELKERKMGCLNFFAVQPQYNEIAIDGTWLEKRRQKLQNYKLPVGEHEIRVRNPNAGKDETFRFEVEAGDNCTSLTVWDPEDG